MKPQIRSLIVSFFLLCIPFIGFSSNVERSINTLRGAEIKNGKSISVFDKKYKNYSPIQGYPSGSSFYNNPDFFLSESYIEVRLKHEEDVSIYQEPFELEIVFDIECEYESSTSALTPVNYTNQSIIIEYNPTENAVYHSEQVKTFTANFPANDYIGGEVTIQDVILDGVSISPQNLPEEVVFDLVLHQKRSMYVQNTPPELNIPVSQGQIGNVFTLKWKAIEGAQSYDLEWIFIETEPNAVPQTPNSQIKFTFDRANRVNVPNNRYDLPLLYPTGYLLFRVRAKGLSPVAQLNTNIALVTGSWSDHLSSGTLDQAINYSSLFHLDISEFEPNLNWISSLSFSEQGKNVAQVSFFDGAGKLRQSVTSFNSDGTVLVEEPLYDLDGRESIKMMPVPLVADELQFFKNPTGTDFLYEDYGFKNFGKDDMLTPFSNNQPDPLPPNSEYSEYFSNQNNVSSEHRDYIAQGDGYSFVQTAFTKDGTGRPMHQSSPGEAFKLGDPNAHFTSYFYAKPSQSELIRLFGSEVGNKMHYTKTMVRDPNGQLTVQYYDNKERIIATAYAGNVPTGLVPLDKVPSPITIVEDMLENTYSSNPGHVIEAEHSYALSSNSFEISYELETVLMNDVCDIASGSFEIPYEVMIYVQNEEGDILMKLVDNSGTLEFQQPTSSNLEYIKVGDGTSNVISNLNISHQLSQIAPGNNLRVVRKIRIHQGDFQAKLDLLDDKLDADLEAYIQDPDGSFPNACIPFNYDNSNINCETDCNQHCVNLLQYDDNGTTYYYETDSTFTTTQTQAYDDALADCIASYCVDPDTPPQVNECENKRERLLADLQPGGQYFDNLPYKYDLDPITGKVVLDTNSGNPVESSTYANDDINEWLEGLDQALTLDAPNAPWASLNGGNPTWDDVRDNWQDSYAEFLLEFHPEYSYYHFRCELESFTFDEFCAHLNDSDYITSTQSVTLNLAQSRWFDELMRSTDDNCSIRDLTATYNSQNYTYDLFFPIYELQAWSSQTNAPNYDVNTYAFDYIGTPSCSSTPASNFSFDPLVSNSTSIFQKFVKHKLFSYFSDDTYSLLNPYNGSLRSSIYYFLTNPDNLPTSSINTITSSSTSMDYIENMMYVFHNSENGILLDRTEFDVFRETYLYWKEVYLYHVFRQYYLGSSADPYASTHPSTQVPVAAKTLQTWEDDADNNAYTDRIVGNTAQSLTVDEYTLVYPFDPELDYFHRNMHLAYPKSSNNASCGDLGEFTELSGSTFYEDYIRDEQRKVVENNCTRKADEWMEQMGLIGNNSSNTFLHSSFQSLSAINYDEFLRGLRFKLIEICADGGYIGTYHDGSQDVNIINTLGHSDPSLAPYFQSGYTNYRPDPYVTSLPSSYSTTFQVADLSQPGNIVNVQVSNVQELIDYVATLSTSGNSGLTINYNGLDELQNNQNAVQQITPECGCDQLLADIQTDQSNTDLIWYDSDATNTLALNNNVSFVTSFLNSQTFGYTSTQVYDNNYSERVITYCANQFYEDLTAIPDFNSSTTPLVFPQEYECKECRCENLVNLLQNSIDYLEAIGTISNTVTVDGTASDFNLSGLTSTEKTALLDHINDQYQINITSTELYTNWPNSCAVNTSSTVYMDGFPEELRCLENTGIDEPSCQDLIDEQALAEAIIDYQERAKQKLEDFKRDYYNNAWNNLENREALNVTYELNEYYYTLYYYDQADNLIKTIPPEGVHPINLSETLSGGSSFTVDGSQSLTTETDISKVIKDIRDNDLALRVFPNHEMVTRYHYNSMNQMVSQSTPDGGISNFWYDDAERLVASQNAKQAALSSPTYSYTRYDDLGRIIESGQIEGTSLTESIAKNEVAYTNWINNASLRTEVTRTIYDNPDYTQLARNTILGLSDLNINGRIVAVLYNEAYLTSAPGVYSSALHYEYDIHGNVSTLVSEDNNIGSATLRFKRVEYDYDVLSGNVNKVAYQPGEDDEFYHRYIYDANNRLIEVETSENDLDYTVDARYFYYPHGPLERVEIGNKHVQGVDYAYTLQGWLKGVNSATANADKDIGKDALAMSGSNNLNQRFGTDAFGFTLGYFNDLSNNWSDYTAIENTNTDLDLADYNGTTGNVLDNAELANSIITLDASGTNNLTPISNAFANLYNGNISRMTTANSSILQESLGTTVSSYRYDQANRIKGVKDINVLNQGDDYFADHNSFKLGVDDYISDLGLNSITDLDGEYEVNYTFDRNGNLLSLDREGNTIASSTDMDDLSYTYTSGKNQLIQVTDNSISTGYVNALATGSISYTYDALGNLTNEDHPGTDDDLTIQWRIDGKVKKITKGTGEVIDFYYDPLGNRLGKKLTNSGFSNYTRYSRDATGNTLAIYRRESNSDLQNPVESLQELVLYGSSRLGVKHTKSNEDRGITYGNTHYENSNHLGNVLNTYTDHLIYDTETLVFEDFSGSTSWSIANANVFGNQHGISVANGVMNLFVNNSLIGNMISPFIEISRLVTVSPNVNNTIYFDFEDVNNTLGTFTLSIENLNGTTLYSQSLSSANGQKIVQFVAPSNINSGSNNVRIKLRFNPLVHWITSTPFNKIFAQILSRNSYNIDNFYISSIPSSYISSNGFVADIQSSNMYYPYGSLQPGRYSQTAITSRSGFNGQEQVDEIKGEGNHNTALFWEYDTRLGRRWNLDPKPNPSISQYATFANNPVWFTDVNGDSVNVDDLYAEKNKNEDGSYKNEMQIKAFEEFASTPEGEKYIRDRAQAGFELKGVYNTDLNISVSENGSLHNEGVDVAFTSTLLNDMDPNVWWAEGYTFNRIDEDGRLKLTFYGEGGGSNDPQPIAILNRVRNWAHEATYHGTYIEGKYNLYKKGQFSLHPHRGNIWTEENYYHSIPLRKTYFGKIGVGLLINARESIHKMYGNTGKSLKDLEKMLLYGL